MKDKHRHYRKLRRLLTTAFFCSGILPILIIAAVSVHSFKQVSLRGVEVTASQVVTHRHALINRFLQEQVALLTTLLRLYPIEQLADQQRLDDLMQAIEQLGDIVDLQVIGTDGVQLAYAGPYRDQVAGKNYRQAEWFIEVLERGTLISDVFSGFRRYPHFVVAITNPSRTHVLRATVNSSIFNSLLHSAQIGQHGDALIINRLGQFQTPSLQNRTEPDAMERSLLRYHTGTQIRLTDDYLYAGQWLSGNLWLLVLQTKLSDSLTTYYAYRNRIIGVVLATTLAFLLVSTLLSHRIVDQVRKADLEKAAMDQQMAHVEKMANIGRLAAGVAHEINNPLQMILTQAGWIEELLPEEDPGQIRNLEEYQQAIAKIRYHVDRAATVTHRLLGFSRKISAEHEEILVNDLITETLGFIENEAQNNDISFELHLSPDLPGVLTDGGQLQQVVLNLLDNALDAVGRGGLIEITTTRNHNGIHIEIADNGPGLSTEVLKQIWDPFFTTKAPGKGTGLGMSISFSIMQKLGGTIQAGNRPGGGAVFTLTVPTRDQEQTSVQGEQHDPLQGTGRR